MTFSEKLNQINYLIEKIKILNANVTHSNGFSALEADLVKQHLRNLYERYTELEKLQQLQNVIKKQQRSEPAMTLQDKPKVEQASLFVSVPIQPKEEIIEVEVNTYVDKASALAEVNHESSQKPNEIEEKSEILAEPTFETIAIESEEKKETPNNPEVISEATKDVVEEEVTKVVEEEEVKEVVTAEIASEPETTTSIKMEEAPAIEEVDNLEQETEKEDESDVQEQKPTVEETESVIEEPTINPFQNNEIIEKEEKEVFVFEKEQALETITQEAKETVASVQEIPKIESDHTYVHLSRAVQTPNIDAPKKEEVLSLFEKYQQRASQQELNVRSNMVRPIKQLISLNDKFVIIKEFFGNAISKYDAMIVDIDKMENLEEALNYMDREVWNTDELRKKEELITRVTAILNRKFLG